MGRQKPIEHTKIIIYTAKVAFLTLFFCILHEVVIFGSILGINKSNIRSDIGLGMGYIPYSSINAISSGLSIDGNGFIVPSSNLRIEEALTGNYFQFMFLGQVSHHKNDVDQQGLWFELAVPVGGWSLNSENNAWENLPGFFDGLSASWGEEYEQGYNWYLRGYLRQLIKSSRLINIYLTLGIKFSNLSFTGIDIDGWGLEDASTGDTTISYYKFAVNDYEYSLSTWSPSIGIFMEFNLGEFTSLELNSVYNRINSHVDRTTYCLCGTTTADMDGNGIDLSLRVITKLLTINYESPLYIKWGIDYSYEKSTGIAIEEYHTDIPGTAANEVDIRFENDYSIEYTQFGMQLEFIFKID